MISRYRDGQVPDAEADPALAQDFDGLTDQISALLDKAELTQALDVIWQRVRRLNRYVEERAPWKLAKDPEAAQELDVTLRSLADGLRVITVLLHPSMPQTTERLLDAMSIEGDRFAIAAARYGTDTAGTRVSTLDPPLFPKPQ
jgi:methionyl-tRNA synthetase